MPVNGSKPDEAMIDEDKPVPRGAYNLDKLGPEAFGGGEDAIMQEPVKPKRAPPARFTQKEKIEEEKKVVNNDEIPITRKPAANMDDMPIGGAKVAETVEGQPDEDKPVPRGAYNLDNLGPEAFGGGDVVMKDPAKPKKGPPARLAQRSETKPAPVSVDDIPIGGAKTNPPPESNDGDEEKPLKRGA